MNAEERAVRHRASGISEENPSPGAGKDRGTYIANPLSIGSYHDLDGEPASQIIPSLSTEPDSVYKSQLGLDKHVLSEKHRAANARSAENPKNRPSPLPAQDARRRHWNPADAANVTLLIFAIIAAILLTAFLFSTQIPG